MSTVTFGAIGHPYAFTSASPQVDAEAGSVYRVYRCFEKPKGNETMSTLAFLPYELRERRADDLDELDEDGWYLSGVGHHDLWCATTLEEAVDAAQEHIAWDGRDPTSMRMSPPPTNSDGSPSHRLPDSMAQWLEDDLWRVWYGKPDKESQ